MKSHQKYIFALLASAAMLGTGKAQALVATPITLDDFLVEQDVGAPGAGIFILENSQVEAGLGGFRDMEVTSDGTGFAKTLLEAKDGLLGFSNAVGVTGTGTVVWDGDDDPTVINTTGLGGMDITAGGLNSILMNVVSSDLPDLGVTFSIYDMDSNVSSLSYIINPPIPASSGPKEIAFFFDDFVGGADFTNVGAIALTLDGPEDIDAKIDLVEIVELIDSDPRVRVPDPTSVLGLLAFGAVGAGSMLKRK